MLITGGTGYVARRMLPALRERNDLAILDVKTTNGRARMLRMRTPLDVKTTNRQGEEVEDADAPVIGVLIMVAAVEGVGVDFPAKSKIEKTKRAMSSPYFFS